MSHLNRHVWWYAIFYFYNEISMRTVNIAHFFNKGLVITSNKLQDYFIKKLIFANFNMIDLFRQ